MAKFMDENFLLYNDTAKKLFFEGAADMPIFDWHCHLSPREIYENKQPADIAELWLGGDHYKWRAMRSFGIEERYITGDASGYEKFKAWAKVLRSTTGLILNCRDILIFTNLLTRKPAMKSGTKPIQRLPTAASLRGSLLKSQT